MLKRRKEVGNRDQMKKSQIKRRNRLSKKKKKKEYFTETIDRKLRIMKFYLIWNLFLFFSYLEIYIKVN